MISKLNKILITLVILLLSWFAFAKFTAQPAKADWFDDSWAYRKALTFSNSGAAVTNQKVKFDIDTQALISANKLQSDCDDIRFTTSTGAILDYYLDTSGGACNTNSTDFYVLMPNIPAGGSGSIDNNQIYIYYGNSSATTGTKSSNFTQSTFSPNHGPTTGSESQGPGPVGYWSFDEGYGTNTNDATINNNDGTLTSGPTWATNSDCVQVNCLRLDGSDDYVSISDSSNLEFDYNVDFTLSLWLKSPTAQVDTASTVNDIVSKWAGTGATPYPYSIRINNQTHGTTPNTLVVHRYDGTNNPSITTTTTYNDSKWHLLTFTKSGSTLTLYMDGVVAGTTADTTTTTTTNATNINIGQRANNLRRYSGFVDDFKIYNYARSATQVKTDFVSRGTSKGASVLGLNNPDLSSGLLGYWKMEESTSPSLDSSGNSHSGTWNGNTDDSPGKFGNGTTFDGSGDYIQSASANISISSSITLSSWVKLASTGSTSDYIVTSRTGGGDNYAMIYGYSANKYEFYSDNYTGDNPRTALTTSVSDTNWHHIVWTYDGKTIRGYLDGQLDVSTDKSFALGTNNADINIGSSTGGADFITGTIDELRIYNRSLSNTEINQLYNWAPGPIAHWKMDENSGIYANDSSGNNNRLIRTSTTSKWTAGKYGGAANFNATAGDVLCNDYDLDGACESNANDNNPAFDGLRYITVSAWVNPSSSANGAIVEKLYTYSLAVIGTTVQWVVDTENTTFGLSYIQGTISSNQWSHVTAVYNGSQMLMYINGVLAGSTNLTGTITSVNPPLVIGGGQACCTTYYDEFSGRIDDVRIYNYPRTQRQAVEDMNASHPAGGSPVASQLGYWTFDEQQGQTTNNSGFATSINGTLGANNSASTDDPTWKTARSSSCKINGCLSFDGGDYVSFTAGSTFSPTTVTATAWFKTTTSSGAMILRNRNRGYGIEIGNYQSGASAGQVSFWYYDSTPTLHTAISTKTYNDDVWHHVAGSFDGSYIRLYVDGVLVATTSSTNAISYSGDNFAIGRDANLSAAYFTGSIDEVKIYNNALTADDVKVDYNNGSIMALGGVLGTHDNEGFGGNPPIGLWGMNEISDNTCTGGTNDICDSSGSGLDGAKANMETDSWVPGKIGRGLKYDGTDDVVSMGTSNTLNLTGNLTIEAWIRPNSAGENGNGRILDRDSGSSTGYGFALGGSASGQPQMVFTGFGVGNVDSNNSVITYNTWSHISVTRSGTTVTFYVNGIQQGSGTLASINSAPGATARLGNNSAGSRTFDGILDEVTVYDYARSQSQIAYDYNRGAPIAQYDFDECQGVTAYDAARGSGTNNNGAITNGGSGTYTSVGTCTSGSSSQQWAHGSDAGAGKRNFSLGFDGTDDYVDLGTTSQFDLTTYSIAGWFKTSDKSGYKVISAKSAAGTNRNWWIAIWKDGDAPYVGGSVVFRASSGGVAAVVDISSEKDLADNNWHHFAAVLDGTTDAKLYIDGVLVGTDSSVGTVNTPSTSAIIGQSPETAGRFFNGLLDDFRIYNYAVSANQVKQIMQNGALFFGPATGTP